MKRAVALAKKDFRDILRERSIVAALLVQLLVAAFSAFLTVGLLGLFDPESVRGFPSERVAYVGPGGFDDYLIQSGTLAVQRMDANDAVLAFGRGDIAAVVEETYPDSEARRTVTLLLPDGEVRTTLLVTQLKNLLTDYERDLRLDRQERLEQEVVLVETDARPNVYYGFAYGTLLSLLVATPVFLAGAIAGDSVSQEIQTHTLHLLRASPISTFEFVTGKLLTPVLLAPAQAGLWMLLLTVNGIPIANMHLILLFAATVATILAAASIAMAMLVRKEGHTQAFYTVVVLALTLGAVFLPRDPFNLIARLAVGYVDPVGLTTLGIYMGIAAFALLGAFVVAARRFRRYGF